MYIGPLSPFPTTNKQDYKDTQIASQTQSHQPLLKSLDHFITSLELNPKMHS